VDYLCPKFKHKMQHRIYFGLLIILLFFLPSCQSDDPDTTNIQSDSTIYTDYFVRYMAEDNQLKGTASFLEGDTITNVSPLKFEGGVSFHGSGMEMKNIQNKVFRYVQARKADYADSFKFHHKYKGKSIDYEISMSPIEDFYVKGDVSMTQGMIIVVVGKALNAGESYVFLVSDVKNKAVSYTVRGPESKLEFKFPTTELAKLETGEGQLYIVKKQTKFSKDKENDIRAEIEYYSKPLTIEIKG